MPVAHRGQLPQEGQKVPPLGIDDIQEIVHRLHHVVSETLCEKVAKEGRPVPRLSFLGRRHAERAHKIPGNHLNPKRTRTGEREDGAKRRQQGAPVHPRHRRDRTHMLIVLRRLTARRATAIPTNISRSNLPK